MRKVISNTTPLLSLIKINQLDVLREFYGEIIVPFAVFEEIESGKDKNYYQDLTAQDWIHIEKIRNPVTRLYFSDLDKGEAEVIILSQELKADLVIIDEILGRQKAKQMNIPLTGTLGILLKAKSNGIITAIKPLLDELEQKGSWFSLKLRAKVLELAKEA